MLNYQRVPIRNGEFWMSDFVRLKCFKESLPKEWWLVWVKWRDLGGNIRSQQAWKEDKMGKFRQWRGRFIDGRVFIQNIVGSMMIIPKLERSNQNIVVLSWFALWKWQIVVSMATCSSKNPKTTNVRQNEWENNCHLHLKNAVKEVSPVQTTEMDEMVGSGVATKKENM